MTISIGEGSRGGHVIGHTKSGKAVYGESAQRPVFGPKNMAMSIHATGRAHGFSEQDHRDAAAAHFKAALGAPNKNAAARSRDLADQHLRAAKSFSPRG